MVDVPRPENIVGENPDRVSESVGGTEARGKASWAGDAGGCPECGATFRAGVCYWQGCPREGVSDDRSEEVGSLRLEPVLGNESLGGTPTSSRQPYYQDGLCTIYHGDALEVMEGLLAAPRPARYRTSFDIAVTSPPYNMGLVPGGNGRGMYRPGASNKAGRFRDGYGAHDDAMPQDEYDRWQRECLTAVWHSVNLGVFYNHRPRIEHGRLRLPLSGDYGPVAELRQIITWDRGTGIDVNLRAFCTRGEWIMVFAKPEFALVDHSASGMGNVWRLGMETAETGHPAPFPLSLPGRCIDATGAQSVLDPFMGSGTTLRAAKDRGVRAVGIDNNERYCEIAAKRLAQEVLDLGGAA